MSKKLAVGPDWDLALHKNGRFALQHNKRSEPHGHGSTSVATVAAGNSPAEIFGKLLVTVDLERLAEITAALRDAEAFQPEADKRQREHSARMKGLLAAGKARRLALSEADLSALLAGQQGGAQ